jgi:Zn-dependent protease
MEVFYNYLPLFLVFVICGSVHEFCHAWSAFRLGDTTSRDLGRLTLNPLAHIDLFGTVLVPLLTLYVLQVPFGWMRPVPVSPMNFRRIRRDMMIVALAGPYSNLFLAFLGFVALLVVSLTGGTPHVALRFFVYINLLLAFLNLLPVPPLDGSSIVDYIFKPKGGSFHGQGWIGIVLIFALFMFGFRMLWYATDWTFDFVTGLPLVACAGFVLLALTGAVFLVKTRAPERGRIRKGAELSQSKKIYGRAEAVGRKLAKGQLLTDQERRWFDEIRGDRGDSDELCSPLSFSPENDFCGECVNFNRCAVRLIDSMNAKGNA